MESLEEPEIVVVNGVSASLDFLTGRSAYFQALFKGGFSEAKERELELLVAHVPMRSEAWHYFAGSAATTALQPRWLERLHLTAYLCCTELQDPPAWFLEDLKKGLTATPDYEALAQIWQTLLILDRKYWFPDICLAAQEWPAPQIVNEVWEKAPPEMLRIWCHTYANEPAGAAVLKPIAVPPDFWKNLSLFSDGLLPLDNWPAELIWSGGSLVDCWFQNFQTRPGRDFDLWIWKEEKAEAVLRSVVAEFQKKRPDVMIWDKGHSIDFLFPGSDFHIQVLIRNRMAGPWQIPFQFDLDYVRAYVGKDRQIRVFPECWESWRTRKVSWWNPEAAITKDRLVKAREKGFAVSDEIPAIKEKSANLPWFHPRKDDSVEYVQQITAAIAPTSQLLTQWPENWQAPETSWKLNYGADSPTVEVSEKLLKDMLAELKGDEFQLPPVSFRVVANIRAPSTTSHARLHDFQIELAPALYPQHAEFIKQVEILENIGAAQFPKFSRSTEANHAGFVSFKLARNLKYGLVFDQDSVPIPVSKWCADNISGMAEITVMLSGVSHIAHGQRTLAKGFYYRFARIQLLDRQKALQYLTRNGEERGLLRVQYFGKA
jgi:hypothetical protein